MTISTKCPGCEMAISAPDSTAGHKAKCPRCGSTILIPAAPAAEGVTPPASAPEAALRLMAEATESSSVVTPSRIGGQSSGLHSAATTVDRMLARKSPYSTLRVLAFVYFVVGIALASLVFIGALAGLIYLSTSEKNPLAGILTFAGGLVAALLFVLAGKTISAVLRLCADIGDRSRHTATMMEDVANRMKE